MRHNQWMRPLGSSRVVAAITALLFFLLYWAGLAPTVLWGDDAKFQTAASRLRFDADPTSHPLYVMLASLVVRLPVGGDAAYRVNLTSALYGAVTLYFVFRIAHTLGRSLWAGAAACISLGVSQTFWLFAERAAPHTLNTAFLAALLWLCLTWNGQAAKLWSIAFLYGLSLVNHLLMGFALPGYLWLLYSTWRRQKNRFQLFLGAVIAAGAGIAPLIVLSLQDNTVQANTNSVTGTLFNILRVTTPARDVALWLGFLGFQFIGLAALLGLLGMTRLWKENRQGAIGLALLYLGNLAFAFDIHFSDQYKYYLPSFVVFAILVGIGLSATREKLAQQRAALARHGAAGLLVALLMIPPVVYASVPSLLRSVGLNSLLGARNLPGRDSLDFHLWPPKRGHVGARQFAEQALAQIPANGVLIIDWTPMAPLRHLQSVEQQRLDVTLVSMPPFEEQVPTALQYAQTERALFLGNTGRYYDMEGLARYFDIAPAGPIYRLTLKKANQP